MRKSLVVFSLAVLTVACQNTPTQMPKVVFQTNHYKVPAQVLSRSVPQIPRGMESVSLTSTGSFGIDQGQRIDVILDSGEIENVMVISSGPYPELGVLVSSEDAKKIRKAKSIELDYER
jgi:hypothetical protein